MNEKIKELVDKTAEMIPGVYTLKYEDGGEGTEFNEASLEKFAELIVAECVGILEPKSRYMGEGPEVLKDKIRQIKQHFGVEE